MKKISFFLMAVAAMAFTMTSCNKEENFETPGDLNIAMADNEVMNEAKSHFVGLDQWWDENDRVYAVDANRNSAWYTVNYTGTDETTVNYNFFRRDCGTFNPENGPIAVYYPASIRAARQAGKCYIPGTQVTNSNHVQGFPVYAEGEMNDLTFINLCALMRFRVTTNRPIDSIAITTEKYMSGYFNINYNDLANPITYCSYEGHGSKTTVVKYNTPLNNMNAEYAYMYIPAGTYNVFHVTIYSGDQVWVKRNVNPITIRTNVYNTMTLNCNTATFVDEVHGATNAVWTLNGHQYVIAKGNLQWIAQTTQRWRFADNQWDCLPRSSQIQTGNNRDRDLFAWGANGYICNGTTLRGNGIAIWSNTASLTGYNYYTGTFLNGNNDWGYNKIVNGGNTEGEWFTPDFDTWNALTSTNPQYVATLTFVNDAKGLLFVPNNNNPIQDAPTYCNIDKATWNQLEEAGAIFLPIKYYRKHDGNFNNSIPTTTNLSYYWMSEGHPLMNNIAQIYQVNEQEWYLTADYKNVGAYVRLMKEVGNNTQDQ